MIKKKYLKYMLLVIITFVGIMTKDIQAGTNIKVTYKGSTSSHISSSVDNFGYKDPQIKFNNNKAYCTDPGYKMYDGLEYTCSAIRGDDPYSNGLVYILDHPAANDEIQQLAIRLYAVASGRFKQASKTEKAVGKALYCFSRTYWPLGGYPSECQDAKDEKGNNIYDKWYHSSNRGAVESEVKKELRNYYLKDSTYVRSAWDKANEGLEHRNYKGKITTSTGNKPIFKVIQKENKGNKVTVTVTSDIEVDSSELKFTCGKNCKITQVVPNSGTAKKWVVTLEVHDTCEYDLKVEFNYSMQGYFLCSKEGYQTLVVRMLESSNKITGVQQLITRGKLTDTTSEYYKNTCDINNKYICKIDNGTFYGNKGTVVSEDEYYSQCFYCTLDANGIYHGLNGKPTTKEQYEKECDSTTIIKRPCEIETDEYGNKTYYDKQGNVTTEAIYNVQCGNPNACTEKTVINIPSYCDDASGKQITITSPKNVVNCILNSKDDAENSYKMEDGQIKWNNPYCSVWCKEDYSMDLPGAKYGNSGRYFTLEDTKVHASRTCYTTGSDAYNSSKTSYINIEQFVKDVKALQEQIINDYNEYNRYKAIEYLESNNTTPDNNTGSCGNSAYTNSWTSVNPNGKKYTKYSTDCDSNTGECRFIPSEDTAHAVDYGTKYSCSQGSCTERYQAGDCMGKWVGGISGYCDGPKASGGECKSYGNPSASSSTIVPSSQKCKNKNSNGDCIEAEKDADGNPILMSDELIKSISDAYGKLEKMIDHFKSCYNWNNNLCFEPKVNFKYDENSYHIDFGKVGNETVEIDKNLGYKKTQDIDDKYESTQTATNLSDFLTQHTFIKCQLDANGILNCDKSNVVKNISDLNNPVYYLKKESTGYAEYNNKKEFATNYPHGTIGNAPSGSVGPFNDYYYLGAVFPIMYKTPTGVYNWSVSFESIGQYNNAHKCGSYALGRLNRVVEETDQTDISSNLEYVCVYVVDCPDCEYECICGDNKECVEKYENGEKICVIDNPPPQCPNCEIYCLDCIFDGDGNTFVYAPISVNKMNPNDRSMGVNWSNDKGQYVMGAIESANESIYKEAEYSYVMTPTQMKEVRDYNKTIGTYVDEDLNFHSDGTNVYGKSKFLDDGQAKGYFTQIKRNDTWTSWKSVGGTIDTNGQGPSLK